MQDQDKWRDRDDRQDRDTHEGEFRKNDVGDNRPTDRQRPDPKEDDDD